MQGTEQPIQPVTHANSREQQNMLALAIDDALLRISTVENAIGLSRVTIYRKLAGGDFPQPIRLGTRCTRWRAADVRAWLAAKLEARDAA